MAGKEQDQDKDGIPPGTDGTEGTPPTTGDATGDGNGGDGGGTAGDEPRFSQAQLEAIIDDRLARERRKQTTATATAEREAREAERVAREDEAKKRGDVETQLGIAQDRVGELEGEVAELATVRERVEALETLLQQIYTGRVEALNEGAQEAVNSLPESLTIEERLAWLDKNAATFLKASGGVPASPAGDKVPTKAPDAEEKREKAAGVRQYW